MDLLLWKHLHKTFMLSLILVLLIFGYRLSNALGPLGPVIFTIDMIPLNLTPMLPMELLFPFNMELELALVFLVRFGTIFSSFENLICFRMFLTLVDWLSRVKLSLKQLKNQELTFLAAKFDGILGMAFGRNIYIP